MKVGDLVKFQDHWKNSIKIQRAHLLSKGLAPTEDIERVDKLAIVVQDWDTHNNFAVIFFGETEVIRSGGTQNRTVKFALQRRRDPFSPYPQLLIHIYN